MQAERPPHALRFSLLSDLCYALGERGCGSTLMVPSRGGETVLYVSCPTRPYERLGVAAVEHQGRWLFAFGPHTADTLDIPGTATRITRLVGASPAPRPLGALDLPAHPASVREARRWLLSLLSPAPAAVQSIADDAVLLLSEVLTNAVRHGSGPTVTVSAALHPDALRVEVVNFPGRTLPHHAPDPGGESGRGLPLLDRLSLDWSYHRLTDGRLTVWFTLALEPSGPRPLP
ncbi:hypothetical protein GCM10009550_58150 [Actinocorallia libanotica]|uniref:Histidine kinase/HSP90-like ATPase domain-containing protein n=2 Tax=Actinocorallia libanotica TaxID=46162 RepID=A0ABN1RSY3_9ACTN